MAKKKTIVTDDQFLRLLKTRVRAEQGHGYDFELDGDEIRCGSMCPITFAAGNGRNAADYDTDADELGISERLRSCIIDAADNRLKDLKPARRQLRLALLEALDLV